MSGRQAMRHSFVGGLGWTAAAVGAVFFTLASVHSTMAAEPVKLNLSAIGAAATASSTYSGLPAANTIDGNLATFWFANDTAQIHWLRIDLKQQRRLSRVVYWGRQNEGNGRFAAYEIYVTDSSSTDKANWGSYVAKGTFANTTAAQTVNFDCAVGRYLVIYGLSNYGSYSGCAEVNIYEKPFLLENPVTGSEDFINTNEVDVVAVPIMPGYESYQITESGAEPVSGWQVYDAGNLPAGFAHSFAQPAADTNVTLFAWFKDSEATLPTTSVTRSIVYTIQPPTTTAHTALSVETYDGAPITIGVSNVNNGSTGGTTVIGGTNYNIGIHSILITLPGGVAAETLSLDLAGSPHTVTLTVTNQAGNVASNTCVVTVTDVPKDETTASVTWSGGSGALNPEWFRGQNWVGGRPPANPTSGSTTFTTNGTPGLSSLASDRAIGGYAARNPNDNTACANIAHTLNLGGNRLAVTGNVSIASYAANLNNRYKTTLTVTNGTLQIGVAGTPRTLTVAAGGYYGAGGELIVTAGTVFDGYFGTVDIGWASGLASGLLDLRNAQLIGSGVTGTFHAVNLRMGQSYGESGANNQLLFGPSLKSLEVDSSLIICNDRDGTAYIGRTGTAGTAYMPDNTDIRIGVSPASPASMIVVKGHANGNTTLNGHLVAGSGGTFTGHLSSLEVASHRGVVWESAWPATCTGRLDLRNMSNIVLQVAGPTVIGKAALRANNPAYGYVHLPPGTASFGSLTVGPVYGTAVLDLYGTDVTVSGALTNNATGTITVRVGSESGSLAIGSGATVTNAGIVALVFPDTIERKPLIGLSWGGEHLSELEAMRNAGRITVSGGIAAEIEVFTYAGATCIGIPPPRGTVITIQ